MKAAQIAPRRAPWRELSVGSTVWAPFGESGWLPAIVTGLGKNRGNQTVVYLSFGLAGSGTRYAEQLYWRKPELNGQDKPRQRSVSV
jgi:hypothetical protein